MEIFSENETFRYRATTQSVHCEPLLPEECRPTEMGKTSQTAFISILRGSPAKDSLN